MGSARDPHQAALLLLPAAFTGAPLLWRGPGISGEARVALGLSAPDIRRFLQLRRQRFPQGWDVIWLDGSCMMGLPRSTTVTEVN